MCIIKKHYFCYQKSYLKQWKTETDQRTSLVTKLLPILLFRLFKFLLNSEITNKRILLINASTNDLNIIFSFQLINTPF